MALRFVDLTVEALVDWLPERQVARSVLLLAGAELLSAFARYAIVRHRLTSVPDLTELRERKIAHSEAVLLNHVLYHRP